MNCRKGPITVRGLSFCYLSVIIAVIPFLSAGLYAAEPKHGGTMVIALDSEPSTLNPNLVAGTINLEVASNILNLLVYVNFKFETVPELAESWKISEDGLTYTFHLSRNVAWHDGKPFTSSDVLYTLEHVLPESPRADIWWTPNVKNVEAPDDYTVIVRLKGPFAPFLTLMGNGKSRRRTPHSP